MNYFTNLKKNKKLSELNGIEKQTKVKTRHSFMNWKNNEKDLKPPCNVSLFVGRPERLVRGDKHDSHARKELQSSLGRPAPPQKVLLSSRPAMQSKL